MVEIKTDERWNDKYYVVNGKPIGDCDQYSFNFFIDRDSATIYSDDADYREFTIDDLEEFLQYLKNRKERKNRKVRF